MRKEHNCYDALDEPSACDLGGVYEQSIEKEETSIRFSAFSTTRHQLQPPEERLCLPFTVVTFAEPVINAVFGSPGMFTHVIKQELVVMMMPVVNQRCLPSTVVREGRHHHYCYNMYIICQSRQRQRQQRREHRSSGFQSYVHSCFHSLVITFSHGRPPYLPVIDSNSAVSVRPAKAYTDTYVRTTTPYWIIVAYEIMISPSLTPY